MIAQVLLDKPRDQDFIQGIVDEALAMVQTGRQLTDFDAAKVRKMAITGCIKGIRDQG